MAVVPSRMSRFRRYFPKIQKATSDVTGEVVFGFRVTSVPDAEEESSTMEQVGVAEDVRVRLAVVLGRFLSPNDDLYYRTIWDELKTNFPDEISTEEIEHVEQCIAEWKCGFGWFEISGQTLDSEGLYHYLIQNRNWVSGEVGATVPDIFLRGLLPFFYGYVTSAYPLAEYLFHTIDRLRDTEKFKSIYPMQSPAQSQCIYCLTTAGQFTTEEHPVPEGLGNYDYYLPTGYVCDACQNGRLCALDKRLIEHPAIVRARVSYVSYTKQGKLPQADLPAFRIRQTHPGRVVVTDKGTGKGFEELHTIRLNPENIRYLAQALYKVVLGALAFEFGHEAALDTRFNPARRFVLCDEDFHNNIFIGRQFVEADTRGVAITFPYPDEGACLISLFGIKFLLNLAETPQFVLTGEQVQRLASFPLYRSKRRRDRRQPHTT